MQFPWALVHLFFIELVAPLLGVGYGVYQTSIDLLKTETTRLTSVLCKEPLTDRETAFWKQYNITGMKTGGEVATLSQVTECVDKEVQRLNSQNLVDPIMKCGLTLTNDPGAPLSSTEASPSVKAAVRFGYIVQAALAIMFGFLGLTAVLVFVHWGIYCKEPDFCSGRYILWFWQMQRSNWFGYYIGFLQVMAVILMIGALVYGATSEGLGLWGTASLVWLNFVIIFFSLAQLAPETHCLEDMANKDAFRDIYFTSSIFQSNAAVASAIDHAVVRQARGDPEPLKALVDADSLEDFDAWMKGYDEAEDSDEN